MTSTGTEFDTATVILAAGLGAFQPRRLKAPGAADQEGQHIHYRITDTDWISGKDLSRLSGELKFDATPEQAIAYIAAFEAHPDIEAVSSVRLTKTSAGKVTVRLTLEVWVEATSRLGGR